MKVALNPRVQSYVQKKVRAGDFASAEEAVNQMIDSVRELDGLTPRNLDDMRAMVAAGIAEADRGEYVEFDIEEFLAQRHVAFVEVPQSGTTTSRVGAPLTHLPGR